VTDKLQSDSWKTRHIIIVQYAQSNIWWNIIPINQLDDQDTWFANTAVAQHHDFVHPESASDSRLRYHPYVVLAVAGNVLVIRDASRRRRRSHRGGWSAVHTGAACVGIIIRTFYVRGLIPATSADTLILRRGGDWHTWSHRIEARPIQWTHPCYCRRLLSDGCRGRRCDSCLTRGRNTFSFRSSWYRIT